jgi:hypothetical protein
MADFGRFLIVKWVFLIVNSVFLIGKWVFLMVNSVFWGDFEGKFGVFDSKIWVIFEVFYG